MKIERKLVVGENEYVVTFEAETSADLIKTASFLDSLPKVGPNGETDLAFSYRTPQGYEYYSIVSKKAGMEYKFGLHKDRPGSLFGKGWEPIYSGEDNSTSAATSAVASNVGLGAPQAATPTPRPAAPSAAVNPQVQTQAQNILAKFGI